MNDHQKILLVEDDEIVAVATQLALGKFGYEIIRVENGEKAVKICSETSDIDLILMDIHLGDGMDGIETAREIRKISSLPLIFMTTHNDSFFIQKAAELSPSAYILKGTNFEIINIAISNAVKLKEAYSEIRKLRQKLGEKDGAGVN